jgi:protein TonB
MPGFRTSVLSRVVVGQEAVTARFTMEVGSLSETVTVMGTSQAAAAGSGLPRRPVRPPAQTTRPCVTDGSGGYIMEPRKIRDVRPAYPGHLAPERITGVVILEGVVSKDGSIADLRVLREPHPDLTEAAVEAVSQWAYVPTLLNCEPIEVVVTVTINFSVER